MGKNMTINAYGIGVESFMWHKLDIINYKELKEIYRPQETKEF